MSLIQPSLRDMMQVEPVFLRPAFIHPVLREFGNECRAIAVRLMAYVGGLAALAMIAADLLSAPAMLVAAPVPPSPAEIWTKDVRPRPAFSVVSGDFADKTATYEILRHSLGGRKDILRWSAAEGLPVVSFALYRPGGEANANDGSALSDLATLVPSSIQPLGVIDTKFGSVRLMGATESGSGRQCLGVLKMFSEPELRLSGLFCQSDSGTLARQQVVCAVNRLILLAAGGDPRLAELFARGDLQGRDCKSVSASRAAGDDWVSAMADPQLRGRL